jgi:hypothetical protein
MAETGRGGTQTPGSDVLKSLLEEQQKQLLEVNTTDDERAITIKLLKKQGLKEPGSNWTTANQDMIAEPLCWFFLVMHEKGQATVAINAYLHSFPQRHLAQQASSLLLSVAATCALQQAGRMNIFEAYTVVEPLLQSLHGSIAYLQAKKIAEQHRLSAKETGELVAQARKENTLLGKLEESAKKITNRRHRRRDSRERSQ